ncbi:hypothetical protein M378DRAFT_93238, partial [Amanita muscaria Koide BX008]
YVQRHGLRKCFFLGGNETCRYHIRQHWDVYETKCKEKNILTRERCMPPDVLLAFEMAKKGITQQQQTTLDGVVNLS